MQLPAGVPHQAFIERMYTRVDEDGMALEGQRRGFSQYQAAIQFPSKRLNSPSPFCYN
jgi:hypothetical protein